MNLKIQYNSEKNSNSDSTFRSHPISQLNNSEINLIFQSVKCAVPALSVDSGVHRECLLYPEYGKNDQKIYINGWLADELAD